MINENLTHEDVHELTINEIVCRLQKCDKISMGEWRSLPDPMEADWLWGAKSGKIKQIIAMGHRYLVGEEDD